MTECWGGINQVEWTEDQRLREHETGLASGDEKLYHRCLEEAERFGAFFYRWPNGERCPASVCRCSILVSFYFSPLSLCGRLSGLVRHLCVWLSVRPSVRPFSVGEVR